MVSEIRWQIGKHICLLAMMIMPRSYRKSMAGLIVLGKKTFDEMERAKH